MFAIKKFWQNFLGIFVLCGLAHTSYAQNSGGPDQAGYAWEVITHRYDALGSSATPLTLGNDEVSSAIPIGFSFEYYSRTYTQVYVSSNGFITFLSGQAHGCCSGSASPTTGGPNGLIAGYWEDLNPNAGGQIRYQNLGNAPNRRIVIDYSNVPHNSGNTTASFQIVLFEGRGDFEIRHQNSVSDGGTHEVGFENEQGQRGLSIRHGSISLANQSFRITANSNRDGPDRYGYSWSQIQAPYDTAVNAHQLSLGDDAVSQAIDIGFPFTFYGEQFTQLYVSSNGFLSFLANQGAACCNGTASPNSSAPNAMIAGYWGDLNPSAGGAIWYKLQGNAPNRRFILEFVNVPQASGTHPVTFSIVLHEGRGNFDIQLRSCVARNDRAYYATGFENRQGNDGLSIRSGNFSSQNQVFRVEAPVGISSSGGPDGYGYSWEQVSANYENISTSTGATPLFLNDDQMSNALALGFPFTYYGVDYQSVYVSSNGFISFLPNQPNGCCTGIESPDRSGPNGIIAGYWNDLNPSGGGLIEYELRGVAPDRRFIVQYHQVPHSGSNSTTNATFQVVLFENGNHFELRYLDAQSNGTVHSTGFENDSGEYGLPIRQGDYSLRQTTFRITAPTAGGGPDAFGYRWVPVPHSVENITNTNRLTLGDDEISAALPMGFPFRYYGQEYSSVRVSSNGFLTFLDNQNQGCCTGVASPNGNDPNAVIAAYWEDLNPQAGGEIWYAALGNAPNRRFVVHFEDVPHSSTNGGTSTDLVTFQVVLYELGNNVEIRLIDVQSDGGTHATGFENELGLVGLSIAHGNYSQRNSSYRIVAPTQDAGGPDNFGYRWAATHFTYDNLSNGTGVSLNDDQVSGAVPIGFPFSFYGNTQNNVYISSNGFISFTQNTPAACCRRPSPPDSDLPNNIIAGFWGDLNPQAGGTISYQMFGASPNRKFVVQYQNIPHARSSNTASFQIVLFEGDGDFEIRHLACANDGANHVTGFEDENGSNGLTIREGIYETQNTAWRITAPQGASGGPDAIGYRWVVTGHSFEDISNTNRLMLTDDAMSAAINIGFDFIYYRRVYNRAHVSPNGFISFLANQSGGCCAGQRAPNGNNPNAVIAGYWEDLSPPTGGSIWHDTRGTAPDRRFIVQYQAVPHFGGSNEVTMQIVLFEGRGDFEIRLVNAPSDGGIHTTGFENHDGTIGLPIAHGNFSVTNRSYRILAPEPNSAGGPYSVPEGGTVRLNGFCLNCTAYSWDFTGNGQFTDASGATPNFDASGQDGLDTKFVTMRGCDSSNNCSEHQTAINITNVSPTITSQAITFVGANQAYQYQPQATDPAGNLDTLTWSLVRGPTGMTVNSATGLVNYNGTTGTYPVVIRVADEDGGQAEQRWTLEVISSGPDNYGYSWTEQGHQFDTPPSGATALSLTDELMSDAVSIGFNFPYYGVDYTDVRISSNGFVTFLSNQSNGCCAGQKFPAAAQPNATIAGYWEDLDPSLGGSVKYHSGGVTPDRRFYVTFENIQHANGGHPVSFQIVLHETTGDFEIRQESCLSDGGNHSTGFDNVDGGRGLSIGYGDFDSVNRTWYITAPDNSGAGGPYGVDEGGQVTLTGSCNRTVCSSLDWDYDSDGLFDDASGANPVFVASGYDGPSTVTIRLRACRQPTDCSTYVGQVVVRNANPSITSQAPARVGRNELYTYNAIATDPSQGRDQLDFELVSGPSGMTVSVDGRVSWIADSTNNSEDVRIRVSDGDGGTAEQAFTINIENRGPDNFGYTWAPVQHTFEDISSSGTALPTWGDDRVFGPYAIGFVFGYYGAGYDELYIGTNGFLSFLPGQSHGCCSGRRLPDARNPNGIIAAYWEDLDLRRGGSLVYQTLGAAPNRRFILQWTDVQHQRRNDRPVTMQIVLYERTNDVELRYVSALSDGGNHATGLENIRGNDGLTIRYGNYNLVNTAFRITAPPQESAGGPYYVNEGDSITLYGQCNGCSTFAWDYDNDGQFDDASGATPNFSAANLDGPITDKRIGLRVCDNPSVCREYTASVNIANVRPTIISQPVTTVAVGDSYLYRASATDPASTADPLTWSMRRGPTGMMIHPTRGIVIWDATNATAGRHRIGIRANDGDGGVRDQWFWLNVVDRGPDDFGYTWEDSFFNWSDIAASGTQVTLGSNSISGAIPIGFDFLYYGRDYPNVYLSSNGFLSFLRGQGHGCCSGPILPNTRNPNAGIAGFWTDLDPRQGTVHYESQGTAPNRRFVIQYTDVPHRGHNSTQNTFQMVLHEGKGDFEIFHRQVVPHPSSSRMAVTGFENHNGTDGLTIRWGNITSRDTAWKIYAPSTPEITTSEFTTRSQPERIDFTVGAASPSQWTIQVRHVPRSGRCEDETGRLIAQRVFSTRLSAAGTIDGLSPDMRYCWYAKASSRAIRAPERGIRFDGIDEFLDVPDHPDLDLTGSFSLSTWMWIDSYPSNGRFTPIINKAHSSDPYGVYGLQIDHEGKVGLSLYEEGGSSAIRSGWTSPLSTGNWHNVVSVYDRVAGTASIYVDGSLATTANWSGMIEQSDRNLAIASGRWSVNDQFFHGAIDDVALWNRALTGTEITSVYNEGTPPDLQRNSAATALISWWSMGDNAGDDSTDGTGQIVDSISSHNATPTNTEPGDIVVFDANTGAGSTRIETGLIQFPGLHNFTSDSPAQYTPTLGSIVITATTTVDSSVTLQHTTAAQCSPGSSSAHFNGSNIVTLMGDIVDESQFTIEAWIRPTAANQTRQIFSARDGNIRLSLVDGRFRFEITTSRGLRQLDSPNRLPPNYNTHFAVTKSQSEIRLYINGVRQNGTRHSGLVEGQLPRSLDVILGGEANSGFIGEISSMGIYYRPISTQEILRHVGAGPNIELTRLRYLTGAWYFTEAEGVQSIYEESSNRLAGVRGRSYLDEPGIDSEQFTWLKSMSMRSTNRRNHHRSLSELDQGFWYCYRVISDVNGVKIASRPRNVITTADRIPPTITIDENVSVECSGNANDVGFGQVVRMFPGARALHDANVVGFVSTPTVSDDYDLNPQISAYVEDSGARIPINDWFKTPTSVSCFAHSDCSTNQVCDSGYCAARPTPARFILGNNPVIWVATDDAGNEGTDTSQIIVRDTIAPEVVGGPDLVRQATNPGGTPLDVNPQRATDVCDNDLQIQGAPATYQLGNTTVNFVVRDNANNVGRATRNVIIVDTQGPTFVGNPPLPETTIAHDDSIGTELPNCFVFTPPEPPVEDNGYPTNELVVTMSGAPDCWNLAPGGGPQSYVITWTAVDPAGNETVRTQTFNVVQGTIDVFHRSSTVRGQEIIPGKFYNAPVTVVFDLCVGDGNFNLPDLRPAPDLPVQDLGAPTGPGLSGCNRYSATYTREGNFSNVLILASDASAGIGSGSVPSFGIDLTAPTIDAPILDQTDVVLTDPSSYPFAFNGEAIDLSRIIAADGEWEPNSLGNALEFLGRQSNNEVVQIPFDPSTSAITDAFTIEAWVKPGQQNAGPVLTKAVGANGTSFSLVIRDGFVDFAITTDTRTRQVTSENIAPPFAAANSGWRHIAGVYNGKFLRLYIDAKPIAQRRLTGNVTLDNSPILLGPGTFNGLLANVVVSRAAKNSAALQFHYRGGVGRSPVADANTIGLYRFSRSDQIVQDSSGNANNGFLGTDNSQEDNEPGRMSLTQPLNNAASGLARTEVWIVPLSQQSNTSSIAIVVEQTPVTGTPLSFGQRYHGGLVCGVQTACSQGEDQLMVERIRSWHNVGDSAYRIAIHAVDAAGNRTIKELGLRTQSYETALRSVIASLDNLASDPSVNIPTELLDAQVELRIALSYAEQARPYDDGSYLRTNRALESTIDAASMEDSLSIYPQRIGRAMFNDIRSYHSNLASIVSTADQPIYERAQEYLEDGLFDAQIGRWMQVATTARGAYDEIALLHADFVQARSRWLEVRSDWDQALENRRNNPSNFTFETGIRTNPQRLIGVLRMIGATRDTLKDIVYNEIELSLSNPYTTQRRSLTEIMDVIDKSSSTLAAEEGDLIAISDVAINDACLDVLADPNGQLADDVFTRCYLRLNDMATNLSQISEALVHTHRWRAAMAIALFNMLELSMYASDTGLPWVTSLSSFGANPPMVLPDAIASTVPGALPVSAVDRPDGALADAYQKYDSAVQMMRNGDVDGAFGLFVAERCLLLKLYNRYYSTNNLLLTVADPKEAPIDPTTVGCGN